MHPSIWPLAARESEDYPFQLNPEFQGCATSDCMGKLVENQQSCYSFDGELHPATSVKGLVLAPGTCREHPDVNLDPADSSTPIATCISPVQRQ